MNMSLLLKPSISRDQGPAHKKVFLSLDLAGHLEFLSLDPKFVK